jgi:ketosteroid isomerase-like protein
VTTTAEVFGRCMELLLSKDMDGFLGMMHPDCVMEFPFAPPTQPRALSGAAELREYFLANARLVDVKNVNELTMHETTDPETIIVEFSGDGVALATGNACEVGFIAVFTARDGLCVRYRDYWNPLTTMAMHGESAD